MPGQIQKSSAIPKKARKRLFWAGEFSTSSLTTAHQLTTRLSAKQLSSIWGGSSNRAPVVLNLCNDTLQHRRAVQK